MSGLAANKMPIWRFSLFISIFFHFIKSSFRNNVSFEAEFFAFIFDLVVVSYPIIDVSYLKLVVKDWFDKFAIWFFGFKYAKNSSVKFGWAHSNKYSGSIGAFFKIKSF